MKVLYVRVSTLDQKTDRQKNESKEFDLVIEDKCSGAVPFFQRDGGKKILTLIEKGMITSVSVHSIDRCGRDLLDILSVIKFMNEHLIPMFFIQQGLRTIDDKGKENAISKMMISILGTVAEMERSRIRENQKEGIELAKSIDEVEASLILPDPQTNGGLLIAVDPTALQEVQDILKAAGIVYTDPIGICTAASDKKIVITA